MKLIPSFQPVIWRKLFMPSFPKLEQNAVRTYLNEKESCAVLSSLYFRASENYFNILLVVYKILNGLIPCYMTVLLTIKGSFTSLRSSDRKRLTVLHYKLKHKDDSNLCCYDPYTMEHPPS